MKFGVVVLAMTLAVPATTARAEPQTLSGDTLRDAISGKTVFLNISVRAADHYAAAGACRENGRRCGELRAR
jgi:hypothetical protein